LLWPFIETYWLSAVGLFTIAPGTSVSTKVFDQRIYQFGMTMYYVGDLAYMEAINKETLKNALARLSEEGIIEKKTVDKETVLQVTPKYDQKDRAPLRRVIEEIGRFRREGKNRRDNANTGERMVRLATIASAVVAPSKL